MRLLRNELVCSATDLANHLGCRHLTSLDYRVAHGRLERPRFVDPALEVLAERGQHHESAYLAYLRSQEKKIVEIDEHAPIEAAIEAMRDGVDVIFQAPLRDGRWWGRADFLIRKKRHSSQGNHAYEVVDTKLAKSTRAGTILQLCLYSDLVGAMQGVLPEAMHVIKPGDAFEEETFRFADFDAYYRWVKTRFEAALAVDEVEEAPGSYPEPVPQCDICRWRPECNRRRRHDDHLSLVAGLQAMHARELEEDGTKTLEQLGDSEQALSRPPKRGHPETYQKLRDQARVQLVGRREGKRLVERLPLEKGRGLCLLPVPSEGDVFFDIEGSPFAGRNGLEYLLGYAYQGGPSQDLSYVGLWAENAGEEKDAFEAFIDRMFAQWQRYPDMHIYHYAPYEPSALKRLAGKHGTRQDRVDELLRAGRLIDLRSVVKQGLRASVERYGLKELEPFFDFERDVDLDQAGRARRRVEWALELSRAESIVAADRLSVEGYNRDDCLATEALRRWLEGNRSEWEAEGKTVARPRLQDGDASAAIEERSERVAGVFDPLMEDLPLDPELHSDAERARWLLAHSLDYHRREAKAVWWEFFRRREFELDDALADRKAIGGLTDEKELPLKKRQRKKTFRYRFREQELSVSVDDELHICDGSLGKEDESKFGVVREVNEVEGFIDIAKSDEHARVPSCVYVHKLVHSQRLEEALLAFGQWVATHAVDGPGPFQAGRDLLLRRAPRIRGCEDGACLRREGEPVDGAAVRLVKSLEEGLLAIQGPPGAGKTHTGARMIVELIKDGRRVGITAVGHEVIKNLLRETVAFARKEGVPVSAVHKVSGSLGDEDGITRVDNNAKAVEAAERGDLVGGTAWLWAREELEGALDYLFVDEAGQMSLANALVVSRAAKNLVLLGDPAQLEQPQQGAHPEGTDLSALQHLLGDDATMPEDRGLFLDRTWRLHPDICRFTSELFYDGRLESNEGLENQAIHGETPFSGSGLFFVPVRHSGNQSASSEEVEAVARVVDAIMSANTTWTDVRGKKHRLEKEHILIVAPYNAQIAALKRRLPEMRIGTVDRFQGQGEPVVIYSMASSSAEDAPRGMSFLYNPNRLNVATSRAKCAVILVGSPELLEPECRSPDQMRWANGLCRFRELATEIGLGSMDRET